MSEMWGIIFKTDEGKRFPRTGGRRFECPRSGVGRVWHAAGRDTARLDRCRVVARLAVDRLATWVVLADRRTVTGRTATAYVAVGSDHRAGPGRGRGTAGDAADPARPDLPRPGPGHPGR